MFKSWFLLTCQNEKLSPCNFLLEWKWTMHVHGAFCGQTKPISISKYLSILKIAEYGKERIRSKCNHCLFILKRCGAGLRQHLSLALSFSEEIGPSGPVICTVNGTRYESLLNNQLIPALQQSGCVDSIIFMLDGAPLHIATPVKQLLNLHFGNHRIISRHFPTAWPPRSPDLNPCGFWLWGYLKDVVYEGPIPSLAELKNRITQHIHNITTETLRSVVEHAVLRF
ncbi:hypothetical protein AVEN_255413-1 [Araneus ventricosus]|uniref:Tc1-like transposase DDE domain-containing protein n=1 Tax=Araneus ventricosus TaxID=182803 RepID=A0A4Y2IZB3_ARAVE|nr:hypothetical protein AVEN_255413-1 [Araneus ventricosus]